MQDVNGMQDSGAFAIKGSTDQGQEGLYASQLLQKARERVMQCGLTADCVASHVLQAKDGDIAAAICKHVADAKVGSLF